MDQSLFSWNKVMSQVKEFYKVLKIEKTWLCQVYIIVKLQHY